MLGHRNGRMKSRRIVLDAFHDQAAAFKMGPLRTRRLNPSQWRDDTDGRHHRAHQKLPITTLVPWLCNSGIAASPSFMARPASQSLACAYRTRRSRRHSLLVNSNVGDGKAVAAFPAYLL